MSKEVNIAGIKFNRLTALRKEFVNNKYTGNWICNCECGKQVSVSKRNIVSGITKSCGCYKIQEFKKRVTKHGLICGGKSPEYHTWISIKRRCYNKNTGDYPMYGGRGIVVCDRWINSFSNFLQDMGVRPGPRYSIDRINNDLGYGPENCKWVTNATQSRNRSSNVLLTMSGLTMCVKDWSIKLNIPDQLLYKRKNKGWTDIEILTTPI